MGNLLLPSIAGCTVAFASRIDLTKGYVKKINWPLEMQRVSGANIFKTGYFFSRDIAAVFIV